MGVVATLEQQTVEVTPGERAACTIRLLNIGSVVDTFFLDIRGGVDKWISVSPAQISVFPGEEAEAKITFSPGREDRIPQGPMPYAVRVMCQEDTEGSVVEEGVVEVGGYTELGSELLPRTVRAARTGWTKLALDNHGNTPVTMRLSAIDENGKLRFRFAPAVVTVEGGTTRLVPVRIRPRRRFLMGTDQPHVFQITARTDKEKETAAGSLVQCALLPAWAPRFLAVALAFVVGVLVISPTFFHRHAESRAKPSQQVTDEGAAAPGGENDQDGDPDGGGGEAAEEEDKNGRAGGAAAAGPDPGGAAGAGASSADGNSANQDDVQMSAFDLRLDTVAEPGASGQYAVKEHVVPKGSIVHLSDLQIENGANDSGKLQLRRNGQVLRQFDLQEARRDWHWDQPLKFVVGEKIVIAVSCTNPDDRPCTPTAVLSGRRQATG
ncbi:hypothetical protein ACIQWN_38355 [Streptomyces vinaceus]|uniref:COG1470 family protein n=1 Tax=Streptomyces vinaceus TaxID=1960 RepID=UPI00380EDF88